MRGDPVADARVDLYRVTNYRRVPLASARTDEEGYYEIRSEAFPEDWTESTTPAENAGDVVVVARKTEAGGAGPVRWFGIERLALETFEVDRSVTVVLDSRQIHTQRTGYGVVNVWLRIDAPVDGCPDPGTYDHEILTEVRGTTPADWDIEDGINPLRKPAEDEDTLDEPSFYETGTFTLQVPEDVRVDLPTSRERQDEQGLRPEPRWTGRLTTLDDSDFAYRMAALGETLEREFPDQWGLPLYSAMGEPTAVEDRGAFRPYNDGRIEQNREEGEAANFEIAGAIVSVVGFAVGLLVSLPVAVAAGAIFTALGIGLSVAELQTVESEDDLPEWAQNRDDFGDGRLLVDNNAYDFLKAPWRWSTYAYTQVVPIDFADVSRPFCIRGIAKTNGGPAEAGTGGEPDAFQLEHLFTVDPCKLSPNDPPADPVPPEYDPSAELDNPNPAVSIDVSDRVPAAGQEVEFSADVTTAADATVESVTWFFESPLVERESGGEYGVGRDSVDGRTVDRSFTVLGDHTVYAQAEDSNGNVGTERVGVTVVEPEPEEVPPVAADAGEECVFPPTGQQFPATGSSAASHFGYGCGDWKVYEVEAGETHTVRSTVDGCSDCVLYDAAYVVEEPAPDAPDDPEAPGEGPWEVVERVEDPKGKTFEGTVHELEHTPDSDRIRIRNVDGNSGMGFYGSVFAPPEGGVEAGGGSE